MEASEIDRKISRPPFCYDKECNVIYSTYKDEDFDKGFSFFCFGKLREAHIFKEKETEHINDLSHCYYTPLKGMIRFFVNAEDLWKEATSKLAVLNRLIEVKCERCGSKMYKVARHVCFDCEKGRGKNEETTDKVDILI
jgi:ribosomal protein L37E